MHGLRARTAFMLAACLVLSAVSFSAFAGMVALDEDVLSDTSARTGVSIDIPAARGVATSMYVRDGNGITANTNAGSLVLMNVALTNAPASGFSGSGNIAITGFTMDSGRSGSTAYVRMTFPDITGRISIENVRCSENGSTSTTGMGYGIWMQNIDFTTDSYLLLWGH